MSTFVENSLPLLCEQCGAPLPTRVQGIECLHCLLQAGLADETEFLPDDSGATVYEHYEILTRPDGTRWELGRGAMGVTYKARDINLDTPVALKIINARFAARADARQRFLREAQAAAKLRHPNVATVFHFGTINALPMLKSAASTAEENAEAGDCFYAMEFVEGETLESRLRRLGALSPEVALEIALQVARALAAAEKRGLVHRDLKPSNIMLLNGASESAETLAMGEPLVKVIDFGLAQAMETDRAREEARFVGTPAFSSPEQLCGGELNIRSDVYSLGKTVLYSITGNTALPDASAAKKNGSDRAQGLPAPLLHLLGRMLAPKAADRPSAIQLVEEIRICLAKLRQPAHVLLAPWGMRVGIAAVAVAVGIILLLSFIRGRQAGEDKSIAVLPFQNLSSDPADAFLAEGIEVDLLSTLVKIRDLKVISRLSVSRYTADKPRDLRAIGRALGVRHVLEGRLRHTAGRILLNVTLTKTDDGHELWAERYDRAIADAITLQADLANSIAKALDATLTKQELHDVEAKPTGNPDAYVLYLRGRKFDNSPVIAIGDYEAAATLYSQAIALDPGFALAHSRLGATLAFLYRFRGPDQALKERAYAEINKALALNPNLGEAHLDKALCYYRLERDFDHALPELEIARRLLPNDTEGESFIAYINRRRGKWRQAFAGLQRIRQRDPRNSMYAEELYTTSYLVRDWPLARRYIREAEAIQPNLEVYKVQGALVDLWEHGDLRALQQEFAKLNGYGDPEGSITWLRWDTAMMARDFTAAKAALDSFPGETLPSVYGAPLPKSYMEGCTALAHGDDAEAQRSFEAARPAMEAESIAHPENALRHARLGVLYAYMGRKADAVREGERAVALTPSKLDAYDGPQHLCNLALIHARVGNLEKAIDLIEAQLRIPGGVFFCESSMSLSELRLRWQWDPLRNQPRFQKILAGPEPKTVF